MPLLLISTSGREFSPNIGHATTPYLRKSANKSLITIYCLDQKQIKN